MGNFIRNIIAPERFSKYLIDFEVFAMLRFFDLDKIWNKTFKFFHRFSLLSLQGYYSFAETAGSLVTDWFYFVSLQNIFNVCSESEAEIEKIPHHFEKLHELIPPGEFYRYHTQIRSSTQRLVHACVFTAYLQENRLMIYISYSSFCQVCQGLK